MVLAISTVGTIQVDSREGVPMQTGFDVRAGPHTGDLDLPLPLFGLLSITALLTQRLPSPDYPGLANDAS